MNEEKKKADRCLKIARRKYSKPSAYRSGAIVRCRKGKIWKGLSESDINDAPDDVRDLMYQAHDYYVRRKGKDYAPDFNDLQVWIDNYLNNSKNISKDEINENEIKFQNAHLDHYKGQDNYELAVYEDGEIMGYVEYTIYKDEITVSHILVRPDRRREGFGSMLIKKMKELHPESKYKPSLKTDMGAKFVHKDVNIDEASKTDFSKEKKSGLHGWFSRRGGGGNKGWVDCNTCKKDPETGRKKCKSCGRQKGERRSKYPSCRPTPSACGTPGKGKKWGKTKESTEIELNEQLNRIKLIINF